MSYYQLKSQSGSRHTVGMGENIVSSRFGNYALMEQASNSKTEFLKPGQDGILDSRKSLGSNGFPNNKNQRYKFQALNPTDSRNMPNE